MILLGMNMFNLHILIFSALGVIPVCQVGRGLSSCALHVIGQPRPDDLPDGRKRAPHPTTDSFMRGVQQELGGNRGHRIYPYFLLLLLSSRRRSQPGCSALAHHLPLSNSRPPGFPISPHRTSPDFSENDGYSPRQRRAQPFKGSTRFSSRITI
ncbi:hypothetical protein BJX96DRAFT_84762 [Aspergillus floccosus]